MVDRIGRHVLVTVAALSAAACAGGGGGSSAPSTNISSPPSPPSPPPPPPPPPGPSATSAEYLRNYALGAINAEAAYSVYATGAGITVALVDTGVDPNTPDLTGAVSSLSTDVLPGRNQPVGTDNHASFIAGIIASNFNGAGTVGVAYGSTILSIRADQSSGCGVGVTSCFDDSVLATGIQYAVSHGAKIINLSIGGASPNNAAFQAALLQAVNAGLVVTVAAGNDSLANPDYPALYAIDPRFQGSVVAVGSTNSSGTLSSFSNKAGIAAADFIAAPGENIISNCSSSSCLSGSGTSFAAPQVAGALALMLQAFPNLTGKQALNILMTTATDAGATGTDAVYGVGILNLTQAFAPLGTLSVPTSTGGVVAVNNTPGVYVTAALGDAIAHSQALTSIGLDSYNRMFTVNLARLYRPGGVSVVAVPAAAMPRQTDVDMPSFASGRLQLTANLPDPTATDPSTLFRWMKPPAGGGDVTLTYRNGPLTLMAWRGAGVANPFSAPYVDPFSALAQPDHAFRADFAGRVFSVSAEAGGGQRLSPDRTQIVAGSNYVRATGQAKLGATTTALTAGELIEPLGPLGSYLPGQSGLALPSRTGFVTVSQAWPLAPGYRFNGNVSVGRTRIDGQMLSLPSGAWSSSWRMALDADCARLGLACTGVEISLAQPLRMEAGSFQAVLPDVPDVYETSGFTYTARRVSAAPSGRQIDLRLETDKDFGDGGVLRLEGALIRQPGNQANAPTALGVSGSWRVRF